MQKKKSKGKKTLMQIKGKNFKTCIMSLGGNDTFKNKK